MKSMEIAMTWNEQGQDGIKSDRLLPPERWELTRQEVVARAREARAQQVRNSMRWVAAQAGAAVRAWLEGYKAWRRRKIAAFELASLDDRSLRDIGVGRSEIQ